MRSAMRSVFCAFTAESENKYFEALCSQARISHQMHQNGWKGEFEVCYLLRVCRSAPAEHAGSTTSRLELGGTAVQRAADRHAAGELRSSQLSTSSADIAITKNSWLPGKVNQSSRLITSIRLICMGTPPGRQPPLLYWPSPSSLVGESWRSLLYLSTLCASSHDVMTTD